MWHASLCVLRGYAQRAREAAYVFASGEAAIFAASPFRAVDTPYAKSFCHVLLLRAAFRHARCAALLRAALSAARHPRDIFPVDARAIRRRQARRLRLRPFRRELFTLMRVIARRRRHATVEPDFLLARHQLLQRA